MNATLNLSTSANNSLQTAGYETDIFANFLELSEYFWQITTLSTFPTTLQLSRVHQGRPHYTQQT